MSSRVQKGNTIFKPVTKAKPRPSVSRQTSVVLEQQPSVDFSTVQKLPSSTRRTEQNGPVFEPPLDIVPASAPLVASTANNIENVSTFRTSQNVVPPTVISTPSRTAPPVVAQAAPQVYPPTTDQAPVPISVPTSTERPSAAMSAVTTQAPISLVLNTASSSSSTSAIPTQPPASSSVQQSFITDDRQEGSSKNRKRKKNGEANTKEPRKRKTSKGHEPETTERERSKSQESRSRGSSKAPRNRKRVPSPPPFDPGADPGEEIDPTTITMSALCVDIGQGRISSKAAEIVNNNAAWKLKSREKRTRMRAMMEAKKYGRPDEEVDETGTSNQIQVSQPSTSDSVAASSSIAPAIVDNTGSGFDYSQDLATSRYNVQVRIGPTGETVIDEDSLVVDRSENHVTENFTHVTESDYTRFVNSATHGKRFRGSRWSAEETELFYDALSQYGENYELIAYVLPGRDRKACKNKFKAEDKKNPARISYCLNNSIPVDISTLSRMTGKDFSGPVPEIRAPPQTAQPTPTSEVEPQNLSAPKDPEVSAKQVKKRSRSKSHGISDGDAVVVVGDVDDFQS